MNMQDRKILVFQHVPVEHPGIFRTFLDGDGIDWDVVELDANEAIPELGDYNALWVMGGPMDVWQKQQHPWLIAEIEAIRDAVVERRMPYLGLCLGHQLLAEALGGEVGPSEQPEIGMLDVTMTEAGSNSAFMRDVDPTVNCLQWHSAEVKHVPPPAECLMSSDACQWQAMSYANHALGLQFHVEIESDTVSNWGQIPEYANALEQSLGDGALETMDQQSRAAMAAINITARRLYDNWMATVFS